MAPLDSSVSTPEPRPRRRWLRRLIWVAAGLAMLIAWAVAMLPWYLGSESARTWMLSRADAALAPARLDVSSFHFSWFGPTRMTGFSIIDAQGEPVVKSQMAVWDRNLFQILFDRPRYGSLTLEQAALDVEREPDGRVDLYEALRPIFKSPPETSLTILARGSLRLTSPGLARPIEGRDLNLTIRRPPAPGSMSWSLELSEPVDSLIEGATPTLLSRGRYDRWKGKPNDAHDLVFSVEGQAWPLWLEAQGAQVQGAWTGRVDPSMLGGLWHFKGSGDLSHAALEGPWLEGDRLDLDRITSAWSVSEQPDGWHLESLDASSDLGEIKTLASPSGESWTAIEGRFDLAEAVRRLPHVVPIDQSVSLDRGRLRFRLDRPRKDENPDWTFTGSVDDLALRQGETSIALTQPARILVSMPDSSASTQSHHVSARVEVPDLLWAGTDDSAQMGPMGFEVDANSSKANSSVDLTRISAFTPWGQLTATGSLTDLEGARMASLEGTFEPEWDRLNEQLAREIEPGAHVEGQPGRFSIKTALGSGSALNHLDGSLALKFSQIDIYGMKLADFALSAQAENGKVVIDPVAATLNGGQVYLEPLLERGDDGVWTLRLSSASRVSGAEVNDEVSRRVLSYIAPVLDRATRVNGRISATFDRAEFPLGPDLARSTRVEGRVVFDDVAFEPGPLANNIMALAGREAKTITLDEPVLLTIADGKVHQTGLTVPIGNLTEFSLVGDVGFDRSLDLKASLPMTSQMVGNLPVVGSIVDGARITVPIGGTLANPRIDRDEFREELKVLERNLLQRTATQGAADLLFRLAQPRPRGEDGLTPRERRQQKRMERRQQRDGAARP